MLCSKTSPTSGCVFPRLSTSLSIADARDTPRSVRGEFRSLRETRTLDGFFISCARACTVASEVFTEAQSFADCKLHIRTRLLASAFSNFWKTLSILLSSTGRPACRWDDGAGMLEGVASHTCNDQYVDHCNAISVFYDSSVANFVSLPCAIFMKVNHTVLLQYSTL